MNQINALPPPKGFFQDDGFTFLRGNPYAEVIPQRGIMPIIRLEPGFPIEEFPHQGTLRVNLPLTYHAIKSDWGQQAVNPVTVWRPFVEAVSDIFTSADMASDNPIFEKLREIEDKYATLAVHDILTWNCVNDNPETDHNRKHSAPKNPQNEIADKLSEFITVYREQKKNITYGFTP